MTDTTTTRRAWRQSAIALVLIGGGFALGAASIATAHGDMGGPFGGGMGWHHHGGGPRVGAIQHMVVRALDNVGATSAQEDKVHDIIAKASTSLDQGDDSDGKGALKKQVLELMKAPTLDRAAFDKLRADKVAAMEAKSKVIEDALFEAASQLFPEQRAKLVAQVEERMEHRGWGGWHHHDGGDGRDGEHGMRGPGGMGDHGMRGDHGPRDGAPDHG